MIFLLAILSGILGRCGGAGKPYNTRYRDIGCSLIVVLVVCLLWGFQASLWWMYLLIFALHWASFATYWDWLFKGEDNLWFSGAAVGMALYPIVFIDNNLILLVFARAAVLCVVWGCLNKFLPARGFAIWRRDVAEEFSRYFVSL